MFFKAIQETLINRIEKLTFSDVETNFRYVQIGMVHMRKFITS
jgi:hypothetical protein